MLAIVRKTLMLALSLSIITPAHCVAQKQPVFPTPIPSGCPVSTSTVTTAACPTITKIVPPAFCLDSICPQSEDDNGVDRPCLVVSTTTIGCPGRCCPTPPAEVKSTARCPDCRCQTQYTTMTEGC